jgi:hypothetical protein
MEAVAGADAATGAEGATMPLAVTRTEPERWLEALPRQVLEAQGEAEAPTLPEAPGVPLATPLRVAATRGEGLKRALALCAPLWDAAPTEAVPALEGVPPSWLAVGKGAHDTPGARAAAERVGAPAVAVAMLRDARGEDDSRADAEGEPESRREALPRALPLGAAEPEPREPLGTTLLDGVRRGEGVPPPRPVAEPHAETLPLREGERLAAALREAVPPLLPVGAAAVAVRAGDALRPLPLGRPLMLPVVHTEGVGERLVVVDTEMEPEGVREDVVVRDVEGLPLAVFVVDTDLLPEGHAVAVRDTELDVVPVRVLATGGDGVGAGDSEPVFEEVMERLAAGEPDTVRLAVVLREPAGEPEGVLLLGCDGLRAGDAEAVLDAEEDLDTDVEDVAVRVPPAERVEDADGVTDGDTPADCVDVRVLVEEGDAPADRVPVRVRVEVREGSVEDVAATEGSTPPPARPRGGARGAGGGGAPTPAPPPPPAPPPSPSGAPPPPAAPHKPGDAAPGGGGTWGDSAGPHCCAERSSPPESIRKARNR